MPEVVCPMCESTVTIEEDDVSLYNHVFCDECGAVLEIVDENPLQVELVEEEISDDDDDEDDDDFDDSDDDYI